MELTWLDIKKTHQGLLNKDFSCQELTKYYLESIEKLDKKINAFISVCPKEAVSQAKKIDELIADKKDLPLLAGVPLAVKDNILVEGIQCTAGSKILSNYIAPYDATVIKKIKAQGAVILGKTNLDEFAMGASGEHSAFGPTKNPHNLEYVPGGSSAGSAAAVAADMCVFALGSDTAGSVRQPASFCGAVGMKATYGAVSRYGLIAMASSLDHIGPLAKTVEDAEIVFNVIKGKDIMDSTSCEAREEPEKQLDLKKIKIGVVKECSGQGFDKAVLDVAKEIVEKLSKQGIEIEEISLPHLEYGVACYYIIMPAEVSSNLARYDGVKYGKLKEEGQNLLDSYFQTRAEFFGAETKRRIVLGTYALSSGYYDAYYLRAQKVRTKIAEDFQQAFKKVDLILMPTSPTLPFKLGEKLTDPLSMYMADLLTVPADLAGVPAISVPVSRKKKGDLPIGIQFVAPPFQEKRIFEAAKFLEKL